MSVPSDLLTSLIKKEGMSKSLFFLTYKKCTKNMILAKFFWANCSFAHVYHERPEQIAHGCSFVMSICHVICHELICHEQPERFAHSRSFVLSDLRESLTVAHLIWAIWANERWANERIPSPDFNTWMWSPLQVLPGPKMLSFSDSTGTGDPTWYSRSSN